MKYFQRQKVLITPKRKRITCVFAVSHNTDHRSGKQKAEVMDGFQTIEAAYRLSVSGGMAASGHANHPDDSQSRYNEESQNRCHAQRAQNVAATYT